MPCPIHSLFLNYAQSNSVTRAFKRQLIHMKNVEILRSLVMKLPMFPKGPSDCEIENPKYLNCVGRFIIGRTANLDEGKRCVFIGQGSIIFFFFLFFYRPTDRSNYLLSEVCKTPNWIGVALYIFFSCLLLFGTRVFSQLFSFIKLLNSGSSSHQLFMFYRFYYKRFWPGFNLVLRGNRLPVILMISTIWPY